MTITATLPGTLPNRQQEPEVFVPAMDDFIAALPEFAEQIDIAVAAFNFNSVTDTSSTSNTVSLSGGNKTFTVSTGKSFSPSMYLTIADTAAPTTNSMIVQVVSYSGTTLIVTPLYVRGSGTFTAWVITQGSVPPVLLAGASILHLTTGNGHGSTNTKIRRFTTTTTNTATADITYADSATLGGSVIVVVSGLYSIYLKDIDPAGGVFGVSKNSNQLTTSFASITESHKLIPVSLSTETHGIGSRTCYLAAGDVIRAHTDGSLTDSSAETKLIIERLL